MHTTLVQGRHIFCRHYQRFAGDSTAFYCRKTGTEKTSCNTCSTCPRCMGLKKLDARTISIKRDCIWVTEWHICAICGAYYERQYTIPRPAPAKRDGECQVADCKHTAFERYQYTECGQTYIVCQQHHRKVTTWRQHARKGVDQRPIIVISGKLVDNPKYTSKQRRGT